MCVHAAIIAKLCYSNKQHFANASRHSNEMIKKSINTVLALNLAYFMREKKLTQAALSDLSKVGQTTISLYLAPERRAPGKTGKVPSAKLSEVESLASALDVEVWELLRPFTEKERQAYKHIESAFKAMSQNQTTETKPIKSPEKAA